MDLLQEAYFARYKDEMGLNVDDSLLIVRTFKERDLIISLLNGNP